MLFPNFTCHPFSLMRTMKGVTQFTSHLNSQYFVSVTVALTCLLPCMNSHTLLMQRFLHNPHDFSSLAWNPHLGFVLLCFFVLICDYHDLAYSQFSYSPPSKKTTIFSSIFLSILALLDFYYWCCMLSKGFHLSSDSEKKNVFPVCWQRHLFPAVPRSSV